MPEGSEAMALLNTLSSQLAVLVANVETLKPLVEKNAERLVGSNGTEGILTRLSHLERTDREMRDEIDRLRNSLDVLARPGESEKVALVRWHVIGSAVGVAAGLLAFLMQIYGG